MAIAIKTVNSATDDVRALLGELDAELDVGYAPEQHHGLTLDSLFQPGVRFFLARLNGAAAGCGGVVLFEDYAELKRMYCRPEVRGRGVARAILDEIEATVHAAGLGILRLETGVYQRAAIRFYEREGFRPREPFGPYVGMRPHAIELSRFFEKTL